MAAATRDFLPQLLAYYTRAIGAELDFVPTLELSYTPGAPDEARYSGGARGPRLQLAASGRAWEEETPERRRAWLWFLAHEAFHLWNGQRFQTRGGPAEDWLSEGGASYLADLALLDLGVDGGPRFEQAVRDHASACLIELGGVPLRAAPLDGHPRAAYSCGAALLFVTDRQLRLAGSDIGELLGGTFRRGEARGGWSTWDLLEGIEGATGDPLSPDFVMGALARGLDAEDLGRALRGAGLPAVSAPVWAEESSPQVLLKLLAGRIGACDCGGAVDARVSAGEISLLPLEGCGQLAEGLRVRSVAGVSLGDPAAALEAAEEQLAAGQPLRLNGAIALDCPELTPLPPRFVAP